MEGNSALMRGQWDGNLGLIGVWVMMSRRFSVPDADAAMA